MPACQRNSSDGFEKNKIILRNQRKSETNQDLVKSDKRPLDGATLTNARNSEFGSRINIMKKQDKSQSNKSQSGFDTVH